MIFFIVVIVAIILYGAVWFHRKKYTDFIDENSMALKRVIEINQRYTFYPYVNFDQTHTYDNQNFYNTISCSDFLIYQLQDLTKKIYDQIEKMNVNKREYQNYLDEINSIEFGQFRSSIGKLKLNTLLKKEKIRIKEKLYKSPATQFRLSVTLYCSTLNGRIYDKKEQVFSVAEIVTLARRLKNKTGDFYNDREIWNALCRVERGKVSNKMRFSIYERDGYRCCRCGVSGRYANLEIDHIFPISKGGKTVYGNLQTLCHDCNYEKSNKWY